VYKSEYFDSNCTWETFSRQISEFFVSNCTWETLPMQIKIFGSDRNDTRRSAFRLPFVSLLVKDHNVD